MTVVSDTSPINCLALIGQADLLRAFFGEIIIPASVLK
jgi:predicted nucleic acid-binding protein